MNRMRVQFVSNNLSKISTLADNNVKVACTRSDHLCWSEELSDHIVADSRQIGVCQIVQRSASLKTWMLLKYPYVERKYCYCTHLTNSPASLHLTQMLSAENSSFISYVCDPLGRIKLNEKPQTEMGTTPLGWIFTYLAEPKCTEFQCTDFKVIEKPNYGYLLAIITLVFISSIERL